MSVKLPEMNPVKLPEANQWENTQQFAAYADYCLHMAGLGDWRFAWDRTTRRLGCCKPKDRRISLSIFYVRKFMHDKPEQLRRTLLHEIAHALAWEFNGTLGHDATWHCFCTKLGIPDEKSSTPCEDFSEKKKEPRYVLCHKETGEVFRFYTRAPRAALRNIESMYIRGRKEETLGKLLLMDIWLMAEGGRS